MPQAVSRTTLISAKDGLPGTNGYRPPEFADLMHSALSDVYSFGVVRYIRPIALLNIYCIQLGYSGELHWTPSLL